MIALFKTLLGTIGTLATFLINTIGSLIALITRIPAYVLMLVNSINILPPFILPWAVAYISVIVVQYILNRKAS